MSAVYASCAFESDSKELGRRFVKDLRSADIKCYFDGDIPTDMRFRMIGQIIAASDRSQIFMPFLCRQYDESEFGPDDKKYVMPICLDPEFVGVKPGGLLTGIRITDVSSPEKYKKELPELLRTIRAILPVAKRTTGLAEDDNGLIWLAQDEEGDCGTVSANGDEDENECGSDDDDKNPAQTV